MLEYADIRHMLEEKFSVIMSHDGTYDMIH